MPHTGQGQGTCFGIRFSSVASAVLRCYGAQLKGHLQSGKFSRLSGADLSDTVRR